MKNTINKGLVAFFALVLISQNGFSNGYHADSALNNVAKHKKEHHKRVHQHKKKYHHHK